MFTLLQQSLHDGLVTSLAGCMEGGTSTPLDVHHGSQSQQHLHDVFVTVETGEMYWRHISLIPNLGGE